MIELLGYLRGAFLFFEKFDFNKIIYIYIYILSSTDRLFHCITTLQCG